MAKPTTIIDVSATSGNGTSPEPGEPDQTAMEQRLQRLEDAIASLLDTKVVEQRIVERLGEQLQNVKQAAPPEPATSVVSNPPLRPAEMPRDSTLAAMTSLATAALNSSLLQRPSPIQAFDLLSEMRAIPRMFLDKQYRTGLLAKAVVFGLVPLALTSQLWFPFAQIAIIGPLIDKALVLIALYPAYRILSREAQRYLTFKMSGQMPW